MRSDSWEDLLLFLNVRLPAFYLKAMATSWGVSVKAMAEIGVYQGKSSKMFRTFFPDATLYLVDPWEYYEEYQNQAAGPVSLEKEVYEKAFERVKERFAGDKKVEILRKSSWEAAPLVPDGLDLVFIDGNHSYEHAKRDIELWAPKVRPGGIISGHDYDPIEFPGVVKAVEEAFGRDNIFVGATSTWLKYK